MGERSPIWDGKASGAFVGLSLYHRRDHLYRAVLEGVSFALRHNIEAGMSGGQRARRAAHRSSAAPRAPTCGCRSSPTSPAGRCSASTPDVEAAMGAAMLAALGTGVVADAAALRGWVRLVERARPDAATHARYGAMFTQYVAAYPALKPVMHALRA